MYNRNTMYKNSNDSQARPLSDAKYLDPEYEPTPNVYNIPKKKGTSNWIKIGIPVAIVVLAAAGVGAYFGLRNKNENVSANGSKNGNSNNGNGNSNGNNNGNVNLDDSRFAVGTDTWMNPIYPSTTDTAVLTQPTFSTQNAKTWPQDDFVQSQPSLDKLRDHPRLIAPAYKWTALPNLIKDDPYLKGWDETIMGNATAFYDAPVVEHKYDGGPSDSGILDPAREVKNRIKHFCYAYRMTQDTKWVDRAWRELENASGNGTVSWGDPGDNWNTAHFLDTAELTAAFAIAYDLLYSAWSPEKLEAIRWSIVNLGLHYGLLAHTGDTPYSWWKSVNGNWNCVSNGGLIMGSLAVMEDDTSGIAAQLLPLAVENAAANCANGPSSDGTWSETANYWYFGTTGHAELTSALMTATGGGDFGMLRNNPGFELTGLYHIYVTGMTSLFNYGDHGPNKFSTTANSVIFYGSQYNRPVYTLFQRDRADAAEPWSMFWYDPAVDGAWWDGLDLDHIFEDPSDLWASFRSSWTDNDGTYIAIKAGALLNHQTHGDLDCGDFVIDAMGQRWAGEYGSANYLGRNYFSNETQGSERWLYYRKMTEGQNVIAIDGQNQNVDAKPVMIKGESSGTQQGSSTVLDIPSDSTAYFVVDLTTAYGQDVKRGIRFINARKQVLLQDELTVDAGSQWRVQTNGTITIDSSGTTATLQIENKKLEVKILAGPNGAKFQDLPSSRTDKAPQLNPGMVDQDNSPARVLAIDIPAGTTTLQVLWTPQWDDKSFKAATPPSVALADWKLDSHN